MYYKPTNLIKNVGATCEKIKIFIFFLMWTTLNFRGRGKLKKKKAWNIYKGTLDIEFEQDWSVGLGAMLDDEQKIKKRLFSFREFSGKKPIVSYCWASIVL